MRARPVLPMLLLLALCTTISAAHDGKHSDRRGTVRGFFRPTKGVFSADQPITVEMVVHNDTAEEFQFDTGGDYRHGKPKLAIESFGGREPERNEHRRILARAKGRLNYDAVRWSNWRRRADAELLHRQDPFSMASVRAILANIRGARWHHPKVEKRDWLPEAQVVERLVAIGPGVLSSVFDQFQPNTISGQDRSPWVQVIQRLGGVQDAPILIDTLALIVSSAEDGHKSLTTEDAASVGAIHACLEKLTGERNTATSPTGRVEFWASRGTQTSNEL